MIEIYTDGSHLDKQNNGRLGCGGVMVDRRIGNGVGKLLDEFSDELPPSYMLYNLVLLFQILWNLYLLPYYFTSKSLYNKLGCTPLLS